MSTHTTNIPQKAVHAGEAERQAESQGATPLGLGHVPAPTAAPLTAGEHPVGQPQPVNGAGTGLPGPRYLPAPSPVLPGP